MGFVGYGIFLLLLKSIIYVGRQAQAVELLCRCYDIPDDGVELRVLKGLLTAITSNTIHVHGQALLLVSLHQ
jgi:hypothetical protein